LFFFGKVNEIVFYVRIINLRGFLVYEVKEISVVIDVALDPVRENY